MGVGVFYYCINLTSVTLPNSIGDMGDYAFGNCISLTNVTIPNSVASIEDSAFTGCSSLASITIPDSVSSIGNEVFGYCSSMTGVYFMGNAPSFGSFNFDHTPDAILYYLPGKTGWDAPFEVPTALWSLPVLPVTLDFSLVGVWTNQFGFSFSAGNLTATSNLVVVVEACTDLASTNWTPMVTNTLTSTSSSSYFSDPAWTNYPSCMYRLRSQ